MSVNGQKVHGNTNTITLSNHIPQNRTDILKKQNYYYILGTFQLFSFDMATFSGHV